MQPAISCLLFYIYFNQPFFFMINNNITEQFHNASEYNNKKFGYASCFIFTQMEKKKTFRPWPNNIKFWLCRSNKEQIIESSQNDTTEVG